MTGVLAVVLHVATDHGTGGTPSDGYVWVYPTTSGSDPHPGPDTVANSGTGLIMDNTTIVPLGLNGGVSFYDGSQASSVDLFVDVEGYITSSTTTTAGATYAPLPPTRVLDSRNGTGGHSAPLTSTAPWTFHLLGAGGVVPTTGVAAVAMDLGATNSAAADSVAVTTTSTMPAPTGSQRVHTYAGATSDQLVVVAPDASGNVTLSTDSPSIDVFIDIQGYYLTSAAGGGGAVYVPLAPTRVVDSRSGLGISTGTGGTGPLGAGQSFTGSAAVPITGVAGVPVTGAVAVALSVTTLNAVGSGAGYLTVWPDGTAKPTLTTVNVDPTAPESNLDFAQPGSDGMVAIYNSTQNTTDLLVDIEGYFESPAVPAAPRNVTANDNNPADGPLTVTWTPPLTDGGRAITSYSIVATGEAPDADSPSETSTVAVPGSQTSYTFSTLDPSVQWGFAVSAINALGTGPASTTDESGSEDCTSASLADTKYSNTTGFFSTNVDPADDSTVTDFSMPDGSEAQAFEPPPGFDADTASDSQLEAAGLPAKPTNSDDLAVWDEMFSDVTWAGPAVPCESDAGTEPDPVTNDTCTVTTYPGCNPDWAGSVVSPLSNEQFYNAHADVVAGTQTAVCPGKSAHVMWVGLGGYNSNRLLQNGIDAYGALHHYGAWWQAILMTPTGTQDSTHIVHYEPRNANIVEGDKVALWTRYEPNSQDAFFYWTVIKPNGTKTALPPVQFDRAQWAYDGSTADFIDEAPTQTNGDEDGAWDYLRDTHKSQWTSMRAGIGYGKSPSTLPFTDYSPINTRTLDNNKKIARESSVPTIQTGGTTMTDHHLSC